MNEKGYRLVQCPGCPITLRLTISKEQYEKTLKVTCPKCLTEFQTTIPTPAATGEGPSKKNPLADAFGELFGDLFGKSKNK